MSSLFRLAGTDAGNDQIRQGTRFTKVLSAIETIDRIKQRTGTKRPAIHIAYLLLRSGLSDIHRLTDLLKGRGISQVVISTLDFVGSPSLEQETIGPATGLDYQAVRRQLEDVAAAGQDVGLPIHFRLPASRKEQQPSKDNPQAETLLVLTEPQLCTENIQHSAFIGVTGTVSPCVFANLPVSTGVCHVVVQEERPYHPTVFGNIQEQSFATIWRSTDYSAFRKAHRSWYSPSPLSTLHKILTVRLPVNSVFSCLVGLLTTWYDNRDPSVGHWISMQIDCPEVCVDTKGLDVTKRMYNDSSIDNW